MQSSTVNKVIKDVDFIGASWQSCLSCVTSSGRRLESRIIGLIILKIHLYNCIW